MWFGIGDANRAKTECPQGHPYDDANTYTAPSYPSKRRCRTCLKASNWGRGRA